MICLLRVVRVEVAGWFLLTLSPALQLVLDVVENPDQSLVCPLDALHWAAANSKRNHFTSSILSYVATPYISDHWGIPSLPLSWCWTQGGENAGFSETFQIIIQMLRKARKFKATGSTQQSTDCCGY